MPSNRIFYDINALTLDENIFDQYYFDNISDDLIYSLAKENNQSFKKSQIKNSDRRNKNKPYNKYLFKMITDGLLTIEQEDFKPLYDDLSSARLGLEDVEPFLLKIPKVWNILLDNKQIIVQKNKPLDINKISFIFDDENEADIFMNEEEFINSIEEDIF